MKTHKLGFLLPLLSALVLLLQQARAAQDWVQLTDCSLVPHEGNDGDSFHFESGGQEYIARLYFVDTPESEIDSQIEARIGEQAAHFGISENEVLKRGQEAKEFTRKTLSSEFTVVTRFQGAMGRSKLPRYYCFVFPGGSRKDLGSLLTEAGLTRSLGQTAQNDFGLDRVYYDLLEARARRNRVGIFGGNKPEQVSEALIRASQVARVEPPQEGDISPTLKFDLPGLPKPNSDLLFSRTDEKLKSDLRRKSDERLGLTQSSSPARSPESPSGSRINLNTASRSSLESLPGIGPVQAGRIIENRPYSRIEDLQKVPRLRKESIKRLAPLVSF
jgi:competence protein ComEA